MWGGTEEETVEMECSEGEGGVGGVFLHEIGNHSNSRH